MFGGGRLPVSRQLVGEAVEKRRWGGQTSSSLHARPPPVEAGLVRFLVTPYSWRSRKSEGGVVRRVDAMCIEVFISVGDIMAVDRVGSFDRYTR